MAIWDNFEAAMNTPDSPGLFATPAPSRRNNKRTRTDADLFTDHDDIEDTPAPTSGINKNLVALARSIAVAQMLPDAQVQEVADFAADTYHVQNIKLFAALKVVENKLSKIHTPTSAFNVSDALTANLNSYAHGVFFSSKLKMYKGTVPRDHLLDIVKTLRFDLPLGIEHDHAKWSLIKRAAGGALTAVRGKVKKALVKSVSSKNAQEHSDIFTLAKACIVNTSYQITVPLLARIALMRAVYMDYPDKRGDDFWDYVDERLAYLRKKAETPDQLIRAFKYFLTTDRQQHGSDAVHYTMDESIVDPLQQTIDDSIARTAQAAVSADDEEDAASDEEEENQENLTEVEDDQSRGAV